MTDNKTNVNTVVLSVDPINPDINKINRAAKILADGGLVAFPTETVYGLGANIMNDKAIQSIYHVKGRPADNPLIAHISNQHQISLLTDSLTPKAEVLMKHFWPGPLTMVLSKAERISKSVTGDRNTIAIRMPDHNVALLLIEHTGFPVVAPSANLSGKPSPTKAQHVMDDMYGKIDVILDAGPTGIGVESTVVDLTTKPPSLLRPGGVTVKELRDFIPEIKVGEYDNSPPRSPGMKYKHYSPNAMVILVEGSNDFKSKRINELADLYFNKGKKIGIMITDSLSGHVDSKYNVRVMGDTNDLQKIAASLYSLLRELDSLNINIIIVEGITRTGLGFAIMNRLEKAADEIITEKHEEVIFNG